jgi:hypothetical protein
MGNWDSLHRYQRLPENAWPNQAAMVPQESPLNVDVNFVEPQGEAFEIEKSLGDLAAAQLLRSARDVAEGDVTTEIGARPQGAVASPSPTTLAGDSDASTIPAEGAALDPSHLPDLEPPVSPTPNSTKPRGRR